MKKLAPFLVILAGCCWATLGVFVRRLNALGLDSLAIVQVRSVFSVVCMFAYLGLFRRDLLRVKAKDLWCFAGGGVISFVMKAEGLEFLEAEIQMVPQTYTTLSNEDDIKNMEKMLEAMEANDDIQDVWHNWEE